MTTEDDKLYYALIVGLGLATVIMAFAVWVALSRAAAADVDTSCLTKEEAKAQYPKQWLYWHTANHCWDNRRAAAGRPSVRPPLPRKPSMEPNGSVGPPKLAHTIQATIAYPSLMTGTGTDSTMIRAETMSHWPLITDFDADPPVFTPWQQRISPELPAPGGKPE